MNQDLCFPLRPGSPLWKVATSQPSLESTERRCRDFTQ